MDKIFIEEYDSKSFYTVYKYKDRIIYSPSKDLREKQKEILNEIKKVFNLKLNTKQTAEIHCSKKWILKTDIKDFYESFSKTSLNIVIHKLSLELNEKTHCEIDEHTIYRFCTLNGKLPTGGLTSAHIANYAFKVFGIDREITDYCNENGINYSRYMDDLIFSAEKKLKLNYAEEFAQKLLKSSGFELNKEKTKYISDNKRQEVLGILVNNSEPVLSRIYKNEVRTILFNYLKSLKIEEKLGTQTLFERKLTFQKVTGYMAYLKSVDEKQYEKMKEFLVSKINKMNLNRNEEIEKLSKVLKLKNVQLKLL